MSHDFSDSNPYQNSEGAPRKKKKSSATLLWVLLGGGLLVIVLCCGGFIGSGFYFMNLGMDMFAKSIQDKYGDHPVVMEHIGPMEKPESDIFNAAKYEGQMEPGELPFKVKGPKGEAVIIVRQGAGTRADGTPEVSNGRLILSSGETIPLD